MLTEVKDSSAEAARAAQLETESSGGALAVPRADGAGGESQPGVAGVLSREERQRVLDEWNATGVDFPDVCTHELFERQVLRTPSEPALRWDGGQLTYRELNERANRVAHFLRRRGVGPGKLVGVSLHRTPLMVIGLLGVWKAGAAYVPLDPNYPADRLAFMVEDAAVHCLLTDATAKALFSGRDDKLVCLEADWPAIEQESVVNPSSGARPADLAYVIYTSGSTGKPKGALIVHSGLVNYLWWAIGAYGVKAGGRVPVHSSISFDLTVTSLYPALLAGARVDLVAEDVGVQGLLASLRQGEQCNLVKITPAHLDLLAQQLSADEVRRLTQTFVIGGENLTAESLRFWREGAPETRLINEYGPTETVVGCCIYEVRNDDPQNGSVPIGGPIANTELYVLDESLQPVPVGVTGELYIGGAGVAVGYLNRPELTRERFLPDRFSGRPSARMYKTGDLARYRPDGVLEYLGRVDNQVKLRGYRIELGEIEATLSGHPQVQTCAVSVYENAPGNKQLVGYVVPRKGEPPSAAEMRRFLKERVPDYMVPPLYVILEALPLTQNGKVDRRALPAPGMQEVPIAVDFVAPATPTEQALAEIWIGLLTINRISAHEDVFDLGATSLLVLSAVSKIQSQLGVEVEMTSLFESPTVAQLAAVIDRLKGEAAGPVSIIESRPPETPISAPAPAVPVAAAALAAAPRAFAAVAPAVEPLATPIRFGLSARQLVGMYHPPAMDLDRKEYCLMCNPFGQETTRAHRIFRIIAERLARGGFHVLRFDYFATGDSAGEDEKGDLEGWAEDVLRANEEITRRAAASRGTWLGLRIGASLAAVASGRAPQRPGRLVLWDMVTGGAEYLEELARAHILARSVDFELRWETDAKIRSLVSAETETEALGYPLTSQLRAQLRALSLPLFDVLRADRVVLIAGGAAGESDGLQSRLRDRGIDVRSKALETSVEWTGNEILHDSLISSADIRTVTQLVSDKL
jgi:amino acid adenylation domain-containing protein